VYNNPEAERRFKFPSYINPRENLKGFVVSIAIFIAVLGAGAYTVTNTNNNSGDNGNQNPSAFIPLANKTVVYGYWTDKNSFIEAVDLQSGSIYSLATLDLNIKKVIPISPDSIIFINKIDAMDYGKEISIFYYASKVISPIISAAEGYGIDDYVISPNKKYLATWEISVPENSQGLIGGASRVYTVDLINPQRKNLIYDEPIGRGLFIHYPLAILDNGELYLDKFEPNNGAGWANGVSVSDFLGSVSSKKDISLMSAGTFAT